ncbi:MAG: hypothetical protein PVI30_03945 [Myxococcales bacterium]|jgi:hypothetical protein
MAVSRGTVCAFLLSLAAMGCDDGGSDSGNVRQGDGTATVPGTGTMVPGMNTGTANDGTGTGTGTPATGDTGAAAGTMPEGTAGAGSDTGGGGALPPMTGMACDPPCAAGDTCNMATGECVTPPEVGCPGGCADGQICMDATCVAAPSSGTVDQACVTNALSINSQTTMECAECLCTAETGCLAEVSTCNSDGATCSDLVDCGAVNGCESACCLCDPATADPNDMPPCGALGGNLGTGACVDEIALAVGLQPGGINILNATMVAEQCALGGGTACAHAGEFGACAAEKCSDVCAIAPACM